MNAFFETVGVVEKVIGELIYNARLAEADRVIQYMGKLRDQIMVEKPLWSERLRDAIVMSGSKERLTVLALSLNSHPNITPNAIKRYLSRFGWESLGPITDMLPQLTHDAHREAVRTHLASLGGRNIQIISNGIYDKRSHVIKGAIQVLSGIADLQVLKHLQKAAEHRDIDVRLELAQALKDSPLERTIEILITLAQDKQEEVRREAVNVIVQRRGQAAFDAIAELIHAEDFGIQTHDDRLSLLIAYTKLGSEHAVELLRKLATQWNPLLLRLIERIREEAFAALAHNQSDKAARLLIKLTGSWRPKIKELAIKATHQRRNIIYGGDNVDDN
jgi:HEAT repeat protein